MYKLMHNVQGATSAFIAMEFTSWVHVYLTVKLLKKTIKTGVWTWVNYVAYGLHIHKTNCKITFLKSFYILV